MKTVLTLGDLLKESQDWDTILKTTVGANVPSHAPLCENPPEGSKALTGAWKKRGVGMRIIERG